MVELVVGKDINLRTNNSQSNLCSSCSVKKIDSQTCKYNPAVLSIFTNNMVHQVGILAFEVEVGTHCD